MANSRLIWLVFLTILLVGCSATQPSLPQEEQAAEEQIESQDAAQEPIPDDSAPDLMQEKETAAEEQAQAETFRVSIKSFKFATADINVNIGDTVVWTNEDSAAHTVESTDGTLESDELSKGDTYKFTFTKAGKYSYICGIHPSMKGSVTVQ